MSLHLTCRGAATLWFVLLTALIVPRPATSAPLVIDSCTAAEATNWCGDGGPAVSARLLLPEGVGPSAGGGILIADTGNNVIRRVSATGIITRIAGIGLPGHTGDGGPALGARIDTPTCVAEQPDGSVLVQEGAAKDGGATRRISRGIITTVVGQQACQAAQLPSGARLVPDAETDTVNYVGPGGTRTIIAGTGQCGFGGDGGPARLAQLADPAAVGLLHDGGYVIADTSNNLIRRVSAAGVITTVAGDGPSPIACFGAYVTYDVPNYLVLKRPLKAKAGRSLAVSVTSTNSGALSLEISRKGRVYEKRRFEAREGVQKLTVAAKLRRGTYQVVVTNRGVRRVGQNEVPFTKTDRARLTITR